MSASRTEYVPLLWVNESTELSAENLNHIEQGVLLNNALAIENALFIDEIYTAFVEQLNVGFDSQTNVFTFSFGSTSGANPTSRFHKEIHFTLDIQSEEIDYLKHHAMIDGEYYPESHVGKADELHTERTIEDLEISCPPITYGVAGGEAEISTGVQELTELYGNGTAGVKAAKVISRGKNQFKGLDDSWSSIQPNVLNRVIGGEEYKLFGLESGFYVREFITPTLMNDDGMDEHFIENGESFTLLENTNYLQILAADSSDITPESKIMLYNTFGESYNEPYEEPRVDEIALPNIVLRSVGDVRDVAFASGGGIRRISDQGEVLAEPVAITELENPGWNPELFVDNYGTLLFLDENDEELSVEQPYQIVYKISLTEFVDSAYVKTKGNASDLALESDIKKGKVVAGLADSLTPYSESSGIRGTNAFSFQTSGGDSDIGSRAYLEKLTGNTAKVVQLVKNGNFADGTNNFEATANTVITANNNTLTVKAQHNDGAFSAGIKQRNLPLKYIDGYKYLVKAEIKASGRSFNMSLTAMNFSVNTGYSSTIFENQYINGTKKISEIIEVPYRSEFRPESFVISINATYLGYQESFEIKNLQIIDIQELENTLGGDLYDFDKFNKTFPLDYYEYTEGTLISSKSSAYKCIGYNAFDGVFKQGATASENTNAKVISSVNPIRVIPGQTYTIEAEGFSDVSSGYCIKEYKSLSDVKNDIYVEHYSINVYKQYTLLPTTQYVKIQINFSVNTTPSSNNVGNISFHLTWDKSKTGYEPYYENYYLLPNIELRKVGDAYDELKPDGTLIRRVGIIDLSSLNWTHGGNDDNCFYTDNLNGLIKSPTSTEDNPNILFEKEFSPISHDNFWELLRNYDVAVLEGTLELFCFDYQDDVAALKEHLKGIHMLYELAEPVIEHNDAYKFTRNTEIDDFGTQEFISSNEIAIPQGNIFFYPSDYKAFIDSLGGRSDIKYDATKIFTISDYNKLICSPINERRVFASTNAIIFKMEGNYNNDSYIPINPITVFVQSYALTRASRTYYLRTYSGLKLNWSQFKGTKKGNEGIGVLYNGDFEDGKGLKRKFYTIVDLINNCIMPFNTEKYSISIDNTIHNFNSYHDNDKPKIYDYVTNDWTQPLNLNSKTVYCMDVEFEDDVYLEDLVTLPDGAPDTESNRELNGYIPGENLFIALDNSFTRFENKPVFKIAGQASIRFGLSTGDHVAGQHHGHIVSNAAVIMQNSYLEFQCLYEFQQDVTDDPGLITGLKIYLGVSPKQFK